MSQRMTDCFTQLKADNKAALIPYLTAGDPNLDATLQFMQALVAGGADILELGIPFSDPMADGPVIQKAHERALLSGTTLAQTLALVAQFRQNNTRTPIVLMGYLNPILQMGCATFVQQAMDVGVDALLPVDLTFEEAQLIDSTQTLGLDRIALVAPTTSDARMADICAVATGYLYAIALKGVTGADSLDLAQVEQLVLRMKRYSQLPVAVGFGIRDAVTAARVAEIADAVIVGSALVQKIADGGKASAIAENLQALMSDMRQAMDSVC